MRIFYSSKFLKSYDKLPKNLKEIYKTKEKIFKEDPFNPVLGTHKIKELNCWAFLVTYRIRVIFKFLNGDVELINIGDHSIYRRK
jgi:mRNA-degrading endonuclease RelE of RelBE toxin-antitoxin system